MKNLVLSTLLVCCNAIAFAQFDFQNINLLGHFNDSTVAAEPVYGIRYQSCWGWHDGNGKEYGVIGTTAGTYIIEVTNPANPIVSDYIHGRSQPRICHEYKTYGNYLYAIADGSNNTFQIMDMSYLPDSVRLVHDDVTIIESAHTLYIDGDRMYVAAVKKPGSSPSSLNVYSLANPEQPVLLRRLDQDYPFINGTHDMFVRNDTVYASCEYQGLYIFHYDEIGNRFNQIGSITSYPDQGYNHSSFLSEDGSTLYMCDEVPAGLDVKVVDVSNIASPSTVNTFRSHPNATPHNPYVKGNTLYVAYYQDGVQAYDISNPQSPVPSGYFDTHPQNPPGTYPNPAYAGCWAVYTDLPSGILLASDMQLGLFILDVSQLTGINNLSRKDELIEVYPNPASTQTSIKYRDKSKIPVIEIIDMKGKVQKEIILTSNSEGVLIADLSNLKSGMYFIKAVFKDSYAVKKINIGR